MARDTDTGSKRFALSFWVWGGLASLLALVLIGLLVSLFFFGEKRSTQAVEAGQRVSITLANGEVKGRTRGAPAAATLETSGDKKTEEPAGKQEEKSPEKPAEKAHEETPHLSEERQLETPVPPAEKHNEASEPPPPEETSTPKMEEERTPAARIKPQDHPEVTETPLVAPEEGMKPKEEPVAPVVAADGSKSLTAAPLASLVEKNTKEGDLPTIAKDGTKPSDYYAKPFSRVGEMPVVSIIVVGLGHSRTATEAALALPDGVSLSFSPYAKEAPLWVKSARALGHEAYIDLPLEPQDYPATDPGPQALLTGLPPKENITRLHWTLARFAGFVGVMALPDTKFAGEAGALKPVLADLTKRGLFFIAADREKAVISPADKGAVAADMILDEEISAAAITKRLDALAALAKKRGHALAVARAYPVTLTQLAKWTGGASGKGVQLAPASALIKLQ